MKRTTWILFCFLIVGSLSLLAIRQTYGSEERAQKKTYTCPMHLEIHQDHPGTCPKCGMNLVEEITNIESGNEVFQSIDPKLKINHVCMMNNRYFGTEQIPVEVEGKMYYGCCQGCVNGLKTNRALRYTKDPYSGEEVDKSDAYIVQNPNGSQSVLYFKNAENYGNYLNKK